MALEFDPYEDNEMCSKCFRDEEYEFGLCVTCIEKNLAELREKENDYV